MRKWLLLVVITMSLLFTGCTVEADRIYTVCRVKDGITYMYNGNGEFFTYIDKKVVPCYAGDLQAKPVMTLYFTDDFMYNIEYSMPTVYKCTKTDALNYVSYLLVEDDGKYTVTSVDWKSFEMIITCSEYTMRLLYTDDDTLRLYMLDGEAPPYIN